EEEWLRAGAGVLSVRRPHDAVAPGAEDDRPRMHHAASQSPLLRVWGDPVAFVRQGAAAAREAVAVRLPGIAHRDPLDADRGSGSEPGPAQFESPASARG